MSEKGLTARDFKHGEFAWWMPAPTSGSLDLPVRVRLTVEEEEVDLGDPPQDRSLPNTMEKFGSVAFFWSARGKTFYRTEADALRRFLEIMIVKSREEAERHRSVTNKLMFAADAASRRLLEIKEGQG